MKRILERVPLYLYYFLNKVDNHSLQGPFVFDFYSEILHKTSEGNFVKIEEKRKELKSSSSEIVYSTFGQQSKLSGNSRKKIADIVNSGISTRKKSALFYRTIKAFNSKTILELGTSVGINTCYLAEASKTAKILTFEGHPQLAAFASQVFTDLGYENIQLINENIDTHLAAAVQAVDSLDFIFIDANHSSEALRRYFAIMTSRIHENSIFVVDDIRWSRDMYRGWKELKANKKVSHSFDLGDFGILFFKENLAPQHFILHF